MNGFKNRIIIDERVANKGKTGDFHPAKVHIFVGMEGVFQRVHISIFIYFFFKANRLLLKVIFEETNLKLI
jgi:hypothetical protein